MTRPDSGNSLGALDGLRVVDLTRILAGPLCTMMLGDMGAEVIKIEPPGGDDTRAWGPPFAGGESAYFLAINRNKRSLTLNLLTDRGREILAALIQRADVVIDNFKLGTLSKWGFDDAWFEANAPAAVRCSITGYGSSGPKAAQPGYDFILQAESGLMSICGEAAAAPSKYGVAIVDVCTGMLAGNAILAALQARTRSGRGQKVEVSLYESALSMLINVASNYLVCGQPAARFGNAHPSIVPYTTYPTADGMIAIGVGNDNQFVKCAAVLGHAEWATDERFRTNRSRVAHRELVDAMMAQALSGEATSAWVAKLQAAGVPSGPINTVAAALEDDHTKARGMITSVEHPTLGKLEMVASPLKFGGTPTSVRRAPPTLGQHSDEILRDELGIGDAEIAVLRRDGVI